MIGGLSNLARLTGGAAGGIDVDALQAMIALARFLKVRGKTSRRWTKSDDGVSFVSGLGDGFGARHSGAL